MWILCFNKQRSTRREPYEGSEQHPFSEVHPSSELYPPSEQLSFFELHPFSEVHPSFELHPSTKVAPWSDLVDSTCSNRESPFWGIPQANYNCHLLELRALTTWARNAHASSDSHALEQVIRSDLKKPQQLWYILMSRIARNWCVGLLHGQQVLMSLATIIEMDQTNITKEMVS